MSDQPTLPGMPTPPRQPYRRPPTAGVRYSRVATRAHRELCADCCADIHRLGQACAPYPRRAVWRRTDDAGAVLLCSPHKDGRVADDASGAGGPT